MDFSREHFVSNEAFEDFEQGIKVFWGELVRLNTTIFILEKIAEFPFQLFTGSGENTFFNTVFINSLEAAILIITRLNDDNSRQGKRHHTFSRFQSRLFQDLVKPDFHEKLRERLGEIRDIGNSINERLERLRDIRDQYIAHSDVDYVYGTLRPQKRLYLSDLRYLRDRVNDIFVILDLLPRERPLVPLEYYDQVQHPKGADPRTDIEIILDDIAHKSLILNMPEDDPIGWERRRKSLSVEELEQLNHYRQKFGLPTI